MGLSDATAWHRRQLARCATLPTTALDDAGNRVREVVIKANIMLWVGNFRDTSLLASTCSRNDDADSNTT